MSHSDHQGDPSNRNQSRAAKTGGAKGDERKARLSDALRENLRKRKAQTRGRKAQEAAPVNSAQNPNEEI